MEYDLITALNEKSMQLDTAVKRLRKSGEEYAKAYTDYRIALAEELIKLKDTGFAITLAGDIARGKREIVQLKFKEITTEAIYKANQESILALKLQIKLLDNQIAREFGGNNG